MDEMWQPTEAQVRQLEQMDAQRKGSAEERLRLRELTTPDAAKVALHRKLIDEFGLPWTIERLGPIRYAIVARRGQFLDPLSYARRPRLDPCLAPNSPEMVAQANSESVKLAQEYWDKARKAYAKQFAA